jgi:hypothetical protein
MIASMKLRGAGHVARMRQNRMYAKISYENLKHRGHLETLSLDERINVYLCERKRRGMHKGIWWERQKESGQ